MMQPDHEAPRFPRFISFTLTNACNLRCRMCGQWSEEGYVLNRVVEARPRMTLTDWKRLVDEAAGHGAGNILIRGGEPFLFKGIMDLLTYINGKGIFLSIDTNGTLLDEFAADLSSLSNMHITFSVDGPEEIHDRVRGVNGSFRKTRENIALLNAMEKEHGHTISKSICFTISRDNYQSLGQMADVARSLAISSMNIVPCYYFSDEAGRRYEEELKENFGCAAYSWKGFRHDESGVEFGRFREELHAYRGALGEVHDYPYMPLTEDEYRVWFQDSTTPVGPAECHNVENLIDIQPSGEANFCVDLPDYSIGSVKRSTIAEVWNGSRARRFREYRRARPLSACHRCGAKHMSEIKE